MGAALTSMPGGPLAKRVLHVIWLIDTSGSMAQEGKIQALNNAVREAVPHLREAAADNPHADVRVRVVRFADGAAWHVAEPTPVDAFVWHDITGVGGVTDLGAAVRLVAADLAVLQQRGLPPLLVLITDGQATDDVDAALAELEAGSWGAHAIRVAIGIGRDADQDLLRRFMGRPGARPISAANPEELTDAIRWASTVAVSQASTPRTTSLQPTLPTTTEETTTDIW